MGRLLVPVVAPTGTNGAARGRPSSDGGRGHPSRLVALTGMDDPSPIAAGPATCGTVESCRGRISGSFPAAAGSWIFFSILFYYFVFCIQLNGTTYIYIYTQSIIKESLYI